MSQNVLVPEYDATSPAYTRDEVHAYAPQLQLSQDLLDGPEAMWARSTQYLRKWADEDPTTYAIRRLCEPVFGGLERTVHAAVGMLFGKPQQVTWNTHENVLRPLADNIDGAGTKLDVFMAQFTSHAITDGLGLLLADHPPAPRDAAGVPIPMTLQNEQQYNLRPRWCKYRRDQIRNWDVGVINNQTVLTLVVLREDTTQRLPSSYGRERVSRFRELALTYTPDGVLVATWTVKEQRKQPDGTYTYPVVGQGTFVNREGAPAGFLPIAIAYSGRKRDILVADLPLGGVAYANRSHWEYASNLRFNRDVCALEQLVLTGELSAVDEGEGYMVPSTVRIGPLVVSHLTQGSTLEWKGPSGNGLAQLEKGKAEKVVEMDQMGLGFLVPNKTTKQTATEAELDSYAQLATLATTGNSVSDAQNLLWEYTAWYYGMEKLDAPVMMLNVDFTSSKMDASVMNAYTTLVKAGFSKRMVLEALQDGGRIPDAVDLDELELLWEAESAMQQEAEREAAAAKAAPMDSSGTEEPVSGTDSTNTDTEDAT